MRIDGGESIAKYAATLPGAIAVFEALGLDYACAGDRSLEDAAHAEGIAPEVVIGQLRQLKANAHASSWDERSLEELTRHLETEHHRFVREELAKIALALADVCGSAQQPADDLVSLRAAFTRLSDIVLPHVHREEETAFPAIVALEHAWLKNEPPAAVHGDLSVELHQLAGDHGAIAAQLRTMRELREQLDEAIDLPARARPVLDAIATLEAHLHEFMFLENCVLFPRATALDAQLTETASTEVLP